MKKVISMLMILVLVFSSLSVSIAAEGGVTKPNENADYYNETTYYTKDALANLPESKKVRPEGETGKLVAVVEQKVYVSETRDEMGNVKESKLMNKEEVEKYKKEKADNKDKTDQSSEGDFSTMALSGSPAKQNTSKGELTIELRVYDRGNSEYSAYGDADWTNGTWLLPDGYSRPSAGDDFMAITWGGNGEFKLSSKSIAGYYQYDKGDISFSQAKADSYAGYCWQFAERKTTWYGVNYYADLIKAHAVINKTYSTMQNRETAMKLTYIHTYQKTVGSISFGIDSKGVAAAGVTLSSTDKQWQIQVDIAGLEF